MRLLRLSTTAWFLGLLAFLGLQVLQVVVAVLPGEPVELMAGLCTVPGRAGLVPFGRGLSSAAVYYCVRAAGARAIDASVLKIPFSAGRGAREVLFCSVFHPGTPKDVLIYLGPFLPVRPHAFFSHLHTGAHPVGDHQYLCGQPVRRGKLGREPGGVPCHRGCGGAVRDFQDRILAGIAALKGKFSLEKHGDYRYTVCGFPQQRAGD